MALVNRKKIQQQHQLLQQFDIKTGRYSSLFPSPSSIASKGAGQACCCCKNTRNVPSSNCTGGTGILKNCFLALILSPFLYFAATSFMIGSSRYVGATPWHIQEQDFAIRIDFATTATTSSSSATAAADTADGTSSDYTLGPHRVTLHVKLNHHNKNNHHVHGIRRNLDSSHDHQEKVKSDRNANDMNMLDCHSLKIWTRVSGDALVDVPLVRMMNRRDDDRHHSIQVWTGQFHVPMAGSYRLEALWKRGCEDPIYVQYHEFQVVGGDANPSITASSSSSTTNKKKIGKDLELSMVQGSWIAANKIKQLQQDAQETQKEENQQESPLSFPYVWTDPSKVQQGQDMTILEGYNSTRLVFQESTVTQEHGFYDFRKLSNYEIVCWIGSQSAQDIWGAFKALRPQLFPHQRPFKFHYYKATSFVDPDRDWRDNTAFRKCKQIFVSLDEPETPLSQMEYVEQVTTFVKHLLHAFDEEHTFPALIWILTTLESPVNTPHCHHAVLPQQTTRHPCNDALLELLVRNSSFPSRVRLLDNTDITSPLFDSYHHTKGGSLPHHNPEARAAAVTAVALRIFVLVGHQVQLWRNAGQIGEIHGLTKNGVTVPNFELERYDWSQTIS